MKLTKKDFEEVAEILNNLVYDEEGQKSYNHRQVNEIIEGFIHLFRAKNPNFDENKFREAVLK